MTEVVIYTKDYCGFCARAKARLHAKGVTFNEIDVTTDAALEAEMIERSARTTVPQIFVHGTHIGGADDLAALDESGALESLLLAAQTDHSLESHGVPRGRNLDDHGRQSLMGASLSPAR